MKEVYLNSKYRKHKVLLPEIHFFVNQIKEGKDFVFIKVNHGWWDCVLKAKNRILSGKDSDFGQIRKYEYNHRWYGKIKPDIYDRQVSRMVKLLKEYDKEPKNVYVGVSHSNGLSETISGQKYSENSINIIDEWSTDRLYYHGGLMRHYAVLDEMYFLIDAINERGMRVHIVGPFYSEKYSRFFNDVNFVEIPYVDGANEIDRIYKEVEDNLTGNDIMLASFGDSESLLVDFALKNKITYIGVGRSFDYLIKDDLGHNQDWLNRDDEELKQQVLQWRNQSS